MSLSKHLLLAIAASLLTVWTFAGCGPKPTVEISYDRPAVYELPSKVRKLAIAEFGGKNTQDQTWGDVASDVLASKLDAYNKKFQRYELVDRKRLKAIMDERDLQISISDSSAASKVGKIADVDAVVYGTTHVLTRDEHLTRSVIDPMHQTTKQVSYIRRHCMTSVNFTLDDVGTSKTLCTVTVTREYDSDAKTGAVTKMFGFGGSLPATNDILSQQIVECVDEFLTKISPHEVSVQERLESGKSKAVKNGNKLAQAGEYGDALQCYLAGLVEKPDDHGASFNAGLMYEALAKQDIANLAKAAEYYDKAIKIKVEDRYIVARKRVRAEEAAAASPAAAAAEPAATDD